MHMQYITDRVNLLNEHAERWWKADHVEAQLCWETEDLAADAITAWESLKRGAQRNPIDPTAPDADERARWFADICAKLQHAMDLIDRIGQNDMAKGYRLDRWEAFQRARDEVVDVTLVPLEKALRGRRQALAGQVRSLGEIRRDLERRLHE